MDDTTAKIVKMMDTLNDRCEILAMMIKHLTVRVERLEKSNKDVTAQRKAHGL